MAGADAAGTAVSEERAFHACEEVDLFGGQAPAEFGQAKQQLKHVHKRWRFFSLLPERDRPLCHPNEKGQIGLDSPWLARASWIAFERTIGDIAIHYTFGAAQSQ